MSLGIISKCFEMFFATFRTRIYPYSPRAWLGIREAEGVGESQKKIGKNRFFMIFSSFFAHHPRLGCRKCISALVRICFSHWASARDSRNNISVLRRSWKVFLGSKFAYSSSTLRKTKQLMVLATSEKVTRKCQKKLHSAKICLASLR